MDIRWDNDVVHHQRNVMNYYCRLNFRFSTMGARRPIDHPSCAVGECDVLIKQINSGRYICVATFLLCEWKEEFHTDK